MITGIHCRSIEPCSELVYLCVCVCLCVAAFFIGPALSVHHINIYIGINTFRVARRVLAYPINATIHRNLAHCRDYFLFPFKPFILPCFRLSGMFQEIKIKGGLLFMLNLHI